MNANELADLKEFEKMLSVGYLPAVKQAIEMLCQQQAEIETLKAGKIRAYDNGVEDGKKSNTNPAKTLTDEEITYLAKRFYPQIGDKLYSQPADRIAELEQALENIIAISDRKHDAWDKAKELLKKASEK